MRFNILRVVVAVLALSTFTGCQIDRALSGRIPSSAPVGLNDDRTARIAAFVKKTMKQEGVPAVSIAVIERGELLWAQAFGWRDVRNRIPADTNTQFQGASISKPVTGLACLTLADNGTFALDINVNIYLKGWQPVSKEPITIDQLLRHRGGVVPKGYIGYSEFKPTPSLIEALNGRRFSIHRKTKVVYRPGSTYRYSGGGFCVVQKAMEDTTGEPFEALMKKTVLDPLGMRRSTFEQPLPESQATNTAVAYGWGHGILYRGRWRVHPEKAAAGLWTTPCDLSRLIIAVQKAYAVNARAPISRTIAHEFLNGRFDSFMGTGVFLDGEGENRGFFHGGENWGYLSRFGAGVSNGRGWVIMSNAMDHDYFDAILQVIVTEFNWTSPDRNQPTTGL